jgi:hypothetical protein
MKRYRLISFFLLAASAPASAQEGASESAVSAVQVESAIAAATAAAEAWLAVVDSAGWLQSHTEAAQLFKAAVAPDVWVRQIRSARTPLGRLTSRALTGSHYTTSLPGAPDGEYVVLTYAARFENKAEAIETVTPMKDPDGTWRVSGYYIK